MDESQPTAGKSVKDQGPVVLTGPSSAPNTNQYESAPLHVLLVFSNHDIGVYIDSDVTMRTHVIATVRSCFTALWNYTA